MTHELRKSSEGVFVLQISQTGTPNKRHIEISGSGIADLDMTELQFDNLDNDNMDYSTCVTYCESAIDSEKNSRAIRDIGELEMIGALCQEKAEDNDE